MSAFQMKEINNHHFDIGMSINFSLVSQTGRLKCFYDVEIYGIFFPHLYQNQQDKRISHRLCDSDSDQKWVIAFEFAKHKQYSPKINHRLYERGDSLAFFSLHGQKITIFSLISFK